MRARPHLIQALAAGVLDRAQAAVIVDGANALTDPVDEVRLLTSLLGPDDTPDGDDLGLEPVGLATDPDVDPSAFWALMGSRPVAPIRELARAGSELWAIPANRLRTILRREVARLEPDAAAERAQAARSDRRVRFDDQPDFMSELHVRSTTDAAAAAYANIDQTARAARAAGDPRTLDQLRSDISIGWLTEGAIGTLVTRPVRAAEGAGCAAVASICLPRDGGGFSTTRRPGSRVMSLRAIGRPRAWMPSSGPVTGADHDCRPAWRPSWSWITSASSTTPAQPPEARPERRTWRASASEITTSDRPRDPDQRRCQPQLILSTPSGRTYSSEPHRYADPQEGCRPPAYGDPPF